MINEDIRKKEVLNRVKSELNRNSKISIDLAKIAMNEILSKDEKLKNEFLKKVEGKDEER